jgi:hypothetical protein
MRQRLAFDLDETLGVPLLEGSRMVGWQTRTGAAELLARLQPCYTLCLWSVANRVYVERALSFALAEWFEEVYAWEDLPTSWKDVRRIEVDFLIDDSPHHQDRARKHDLAASYIVVPGYGSPADMADPLAWVRLVEAALGLSPSGA